ncbi:hypothetical protein [Thiothrix lacustris]|uniref:HPt domain-containing protein n=1 Tax=Thiothrix lacustris TaxID=525917 RepID=A0ABY9MLE0_9GAMM|nr:hypothetical protein [Thiothrix lacustris]WML89484.1 hypothetical protein RCF98_10930 [Thiothrix lacustris]WMP18975.1 hypothetical protein RCS87_07895 [Thiothrix lacustris]
MNLSSPLDSLLDILGTEGTQCFLTFAQPNIQQYHHDITESLKQKNWDAAAAMAHRFKATAHLYSTATLQNLLDNIIAKQIAILQHPEFCQQLLLEFQYIETNIDSFLKKTTLINP